MEPQVTRRKPPSYLDAMFGADLFWDGRATSAFADPQSGIITIAAGGALESQSVGPPVNDADTGHRTDDSHAARPRPGPEGP